MIQLASNCHFLNYPSLLGLLVQDVLVEFGGGGLLLLVVVVHAVGGDYAAGEVVDREGLGCVDAEGQVGDGGAVAAAAPGVNSDAGRLDLRVDGVVVGFGLDLDHDHLGAAVGGGPGWHAWSGLDL